METEGFPQRRPYLFSFMLLLLLIVVNGAGVAIAQSTGLPLTSIVVYTELALAIILVVIVSKLGWWQEIGFRKATRPGVLWLFAPSLALFLGNLTFGIHVTHASALATFTLLALLSGFVEEVIFRGLILRALLSRGEGTALLVTTLLFGFAHAGNALAGSDPLYVTVQIAYSLAIGFGFGAMALRGRLLWPLVLAHGLGNFIAFINTGDQQQVTGSPVSMHLLIMLVLYIMIFTGYGLYLRTTPGKAGP